jgi:hypothetical protein
MFRWFKKQNTDENDTEMLVLEMDAVEIALQRSREEGLDVEVVTWALRHMKKNPSLTISEAITMGFYEWVK